MGSFGGRAGRKINCFNADLRGSCAEDGHSLCERARPDAGAIRGSFTPRRSAIAQVNPYFVDELLIGCEIQTLEAESQCFLDQLSPIHAPMWRRVFSPTSSTHRAPVHGAVCRTGSNPVIRVDPKLPLSVGLARAAVPREARLTRAGVW